MEDLSVVITFLGWCAVINTAVLFVSTIMIYALSEPIKSIHAKISNIDPEELDKIYFNFLGNYKLAIFMLNLAPYLALKIMG